MSIPFRKVWRDLWNHKGRTLLVVISIAVGVLALGLTTASHTFLNRQMNLARAANRSPHARLTLSAALDEEAVEVVARLPEVAEAEGWITATIRWKRDPGGAWGEAALMARADYDRQTFDLLERKTGRWPGPDEIAVEAGHQEHYSVPDIGGTLYVDVNDRPVPLTLSGTLRDPAQAPPQFNPTNRPAFYVDLDTAERLLGSRDYNHLRFTVPEYSREAVEEATEAVENKLKRLGASRAFEAISTAEFQDPDRSAQQEFINGLSTVLTVLASLSMGLSVVLVVNTINAVVAQQVTQIGIMKTVGAESGKIASMYLAGVAVYGLLSLLLAVPLGMFIGYQLASTWLAAFNVPRPPFTILSDSFAYQVGVGLLTPLAAALWPVLQGVRIPVQQAIAAYGVGGGRYGANRLDRLLGRIRGMPRMAALSLRNTFRRTSRVALTEITLIAAGAIFMMVMATGASFRATFDAVWESWGFDVVVVLDDFYRVHKAEVAARTIPEVDQVEMWTWTQANGHIPGRTEQGDVKTMQLRGVPDNSRMFRPALVAGRSFEPGDGHAVVLNQGLAGDLGVGIGEPIVIDTGGGYETTWTVIGTAFDIGVGGQQNTVFMRRNVLNADLQKVGRATVAQVGTTQSTREVQNRVKKRLQDYFGTQGIGVTLAVGEIENKQLAGILWNIVGGLLQSMTLLMAIVGSVGLSGTLSLNVMERRREIGVMRAVGASSADVAFIFMGEGLLLGLLSWTLAIPLSIVGARLFVTLLGEALDFPFFYTYSLQGAWIWLAVIVVLSAAASWFPARQATQISVRESLAYE